MHRKAAVTAKRQKNAVANLAGEVKGDGTPKMPTTEKWRRRWLKFYKFLACVAFCAIAMPYFEILVSVGAGQYATVFTWIASALLFTVGYAIHAGIRCLFTKGGAQEQFSFSFETKWQFSSPGVMIPSLILGAVVAICFSLVSGQVLESLLYPYYNAEVGFPLIMIACVAASVLGSLLVPFQFHQLCSLRTLIECLFAFGIPFAIATWTGAGVNGLFAACALIYALCLFVLMNQEYIIKPSYSAETCYATRELRLHGMVRAVGMWLTTLVTALLVLSFMSIFVTPFRFLRFFETEEVLAFPFAGMPEVNLFMFFVGLTLIPILSIICIVRFVRPRGLKYWEKIIKEFLGKLVGFFLRLRFRRKDRLNDMEFKQVIGERPKKQHYVDTVTETKVKTVQRPKGYRAFVKQLKTLSDINEQYKFAYEVLITELYDAHIGIAKHQTPLEMAAVISRKTNISDMDRLTATFADVTYAKDKAASPRDVEAVCQILQTRLKA